MRYEINFNRYFHPYTPPRFLEEIEARIQAIEKDILSLLREVVGVRTVGPYPTHGFGRHRRCRGLPPN